MSLPEDVTNMHVGDKQRTRDRAPSNPATIHEQRYVLAGMAFLRHMAERPRAQASEMMPLACQITMRVS